MESTMNAIMVNVRHVNGRTGEHIQKSPLTKNRVTPKGSAVSGQLIFCNHSPSLQLYFHSIEKRLVIMRNKSHLKRVIRSSSLYLHERV